MTKRRADIGGVGPNSARYGALIDKYVTDRRGEGKSFERSAVATIIVIAPEIHRCPNYTYHNILQCTVADGSCSVLMYISSCIFNLMFSPVSPHFTLHCHFDHRCCSVIAGVNIVSPVRILEDIDNARSVQCLDN